MKMCYKALLLGLFVFASEIVFGDTLHTYYSEAQVIPTVDADEDYDDEVEIEVEEEEKDIIEIDFKPASTLKAINTIPNITNAQKKKSLIS